MYNVGGDCAHCNCIILYACRTCAVVVRVNSRWQWFSWFSNGESTSLVFYFHSCSRNTHLVLLSFPHRYEYCTATRSSTRNIISSTRLKCRILPWNYQQHNIANKRFALLQAQNIIYKLIMFKNDIFMPNVLLNTRW